MAPSPYLKQNRLAAVASIQFMSLAVTELEPHNIDVQRFMWTSVEYTEADRADYEGKND